MKRKSIPILEGYLRAWEKVCELYQYQVRLDLALSNKPICSLSGPITHWRELRTHLLQSKDHELVVKNFRGDHDHADLLDQISSIPEELDSWIRSSRRIFRLNPDLQDLLACTSLDHVSWRDVTWPFESFLIALALPFQDDGTSFSHILVTRHKWVFKEKEETVLGLRLLDSRLCSVRPLTLQEKKLLDRDLARKDIETCLKHSRKYSRQDLEHIQYNAFFLTLDNIENISVTASVDKLLKQSIKERKLDASQITEDPSNLRNSTVRIVIGLCLYLATLTPKDRERVVRKESPPQRKGIPDSKAIFLESDVMHVKSIHVISNEEQKLFRDVAIKGEQADVRAHFRRGHWRRAPGSGNDPDAPKIVHVRPCLVRKDRLLAGMIPGGATSKVQ